MKTLLLLRHAKSSWKDSDIDDHERPLNKRGKKDAPRNYPSHEECVHERVGMIHHEQNRPMSRNAVATFDLDRSIEPSKGDAGQRAQDRVHV